MGDMEYSPLEPQQATAGSVLEAVDDRRGLVSGALDRDHRSEHGQFFTPAPIARFMASLFVFDDERPIALLDPGAGMGVLAAATAQVRGNRPMSVTAYETEPTFATELRATLASLDRVEAVVHSRDFVAHATMLATIGDSPAYTHAILNPPYRKIGARSQYRLWAKKLGLEVTNLYACFLACTVVLCRSHAQVVAIVPRSFMNGTYFRSFRQWLLQRAAITHIHVFGRRDSAFADDSVLQENVILRLVVGGRQQSVDVSTSTDQRLEDVAVRVCAFSEIVAADDSDLTLHVPTLDSIGAVGLPGSTLRELGLDVCTGPVVDFRLRNHINSDPKPGTVPLLYASHFAGGRFQWPRQGRKPNAIKRNVETEKWLMPNGCYVVLRRFTSKEERRRIVAYLFDGTRIPVDVVGFENHLNIIHQSRRGLSPTIARGLVAYLNSEEVDNYFRTFSGHTQVNATDLRRLRFPSTDELVRLGEQNR